MAAIVLASHLPGEGHFRSERHRVVPILCRDPLDYWRGLAEWWDSDETLVNLEHDIEATDDQVDELLDCQHSLCSWAYRCHWASTGLPHDVYAHGTGDRYRNTHYLTGGEPWADWSAIGFLKIGPGARVGPLAPATWSEVELSIEAAIDGPVHMHWPEVTHHHW